MADGDVTDVLGPDVGAPSRNPILLVPSADIARLLTDVHVIAHARSTRKAERWADLLTPNAYLTQIDDLVA